MFAKMFFVFEKVNQCSDIGLTKYLAVKKFYVSVL